MEVAINMRNRTFLAIAALTLTLGWASNAQAQAQPTSDQANPLTDFQNPNGGNDPFNNRTGDSNSNMLQLMQRLMQQSGTSPTEFRAAQQENLTDAAAMFRAKQQARLKQQQGLQPVAPVAPIVPAMPLAPLTP
jgi:hypothetical protein